MNKMERKLEKLAKEYQCLVSRDEYGNIINLTEDECSCFMYKRMEEGWWILEDRLNAVIIPYEKGDEERNKKIVKEYWIKIDKETEIEKKEVRV